MVVGFDAQYFLYYIGNIACMVRYLEWKSRNGCCLQSIGTSLLIRLTMRPVSSPYSS